MNNIKDFKSYNEGFFSDLKRRRKENKELEKLDNEIKKELSKYINEKFLFQYSVYIWKSNYENYEEIDVNYFKLVDIMVTPTFDLNKEGIKGIILYLYFIDKDGDEIAVTFNENTPLQKMINLEYKNISQRGKDILHGSFTKDEDKISIDYYENPKNYPRKNGFIDLVPNEYKTIELLQDVKHIFDVLVDQIK